MILKYNGNWINEVNGINKTEYWIFRRANARHPLGKSAQSGCPLAAFPLAKPLHLRPTRRGGLVSPHPVARPHSCFRARGAVPCIRGGVTPAEAPATSR